MKYSLTLSLGFAALLSGAALADPAFGTYQTIKDDNGNYGQIAVAACGDKICGTLAKSFNSNGEPIESANTGKNIIWDMEADGDGKYNGGKVWDPARDKTYNSRMVLVGQDLKISGCILGICRDGGTWIRVN